MDTKYHLKDGEFIIENYNHAKPFSSFLPGIAGLDGKPLWAFYVNRGQGMVSFGINNKEGAIMEFYPANTAYRRVTVEGFRTFVKIKDGPRERVYEPFAVHPVSRKTAPVQTLYVAPYEFRITEDARDVGLLFETVYFTIPHETFPALGRILTITDTSSKARRIEVIDGMPKLMPYGMNEFFMKHMSRTIEAWMEVEGLDEKSPFYRLRVDAADVSETRYITSGNFYLSVTGTNTKPSIIVDPRVIFGDYYDLVCPEMFACRSFKIPARQITKNITPSAFSHTVLNIASKGTGAVASIIGHASSQDELGRIAKKVDTVYFARKRAENAHATDRIASSVSTFSADPAFDAYVRQTNLDNILRGGYPITVGSHRTPLYVYNRKHGDLERDYNNFTLKASRYSQGNGNFRDANQNRRASAWLNPSVGAKDIKDFYNLIQLDGYNPLVVKGDIFFIEDRAAVKRLVKAYFTSAKDAGLFLGREFTIDELIVSLDHLDPKTDVDGYIDDVMTNASSRIDADFGEGYWVDHWTYNLDLVESFRALYPEKVRDLLLNERDYLWYESDHVVKPRRERLSRDSKGRIRQYHSLAVDTEKKALIASRTAYRCWARASRGTGDLYRSTLAVKMLALIATRVATLDPFGVGIEMEADKPGWCDSMNGLPGLIGSSQCETFELMRAAAFLEEALTQSGSGSIAVFEELADFVVALTKALRKDASSGGEGLRYWNASNDAKETYRQRVRLGVSGKERPLSKEALVEFCARVREKSARGTRKGRTRDGVPYTYFINEVVSLGKNNIPARFKQKPLPLFLEAPVHALKVADEKGARALYGAVKRSELYDRVLGMYRVNASLAKESLEVGRSRVFTPGWLENESIWLHMEYKYLLELLRRGLYREYFADLKTALIPFQDPARYGRSILENSSFLASSAFFDKALVGNGFVARLSGATAEFLSMLLMMNFGTGPFRLDGDELLFTPRPVLPQELFTTAEKTIEYVFRDGAHEAVLPAHSYACSIFTHTLIVYHNPKMRNTFGADGVTVKRFSVTYENAKKMTRERPVLGEPCSRDLRGGMIRRIDIELG